MITELGQTIIELRKTGLSVKKIAKKIGVSISTASKWASFADTHEESIIKNRIECGNNKVCKRQKERELILQTGNKSWATRNGYNKLLRTANKAFLVFKAGGKCNGCEYDKYFGNLAFHHISGKKEFDISRRKLVNIRVLLDEVNKCVLVCHNCHGEIHAGLRNTPTTTIPICSDDLPSSTIEWFLKETSWADSVNGSTRPLQGRGAGSIPARSTILEEL